MDNIEGAQRILQSYGDVPAIINTFIRDYTMAIARKELETDTRFSHIVKREDGSYAALLLPIQKEG